MWQSIFCCVQGEQAYSFVGIALKNVGVIGAVKRLPLHRKAKLMELHLLPGSIVVESHYLLVELNGIPAFMEI